MVCLERGIKIRAFLAFLLLFSLFLGGAFAQTPAGLKVSPAANREYLPGDFVQVIVETPPDTAQINAVMPDGSTVSLVQERRRNVWRGIWEVPIDFKKGTYTAKLSAVDLEGNIFEGQTDAFIIGELALVTLVGKPTVEAAPPAPIASLITPEKVITAPAIALPPELMPEEKAKLVERNMLAGKASLERGSYSESATYFRVALYLEPKHKDAAFFLSEVQEKAAREKTLAQQEAKRRFQSQLFIAAALAAIIALALWLLTPILRAAKPPVAAPKTVSEEEKRKLWLKKAGWKNNPFTEDIFQKLFSGDKKLEFDGLKNFIRGRAENAGGVGLGPLTEPALDEIFKLSSGKPKTAVKICEWAVEKAIERNADSITAELIREFQELKTATILIADDEEIVRTSLDGILRLGGGYKTELAADGEEAMGKIKENAFDLLLLDIAMPKIDGYEILRQVRAVNPALPIIFISGKGVADRVMESLSRYNLTAYIEKPFTMEKVLDTVAKSLK